MIEAGALPVFIKLLSSNFEDVQEQVILLYCYINLNYMINKTLLKRQSGLWVI